MTNADKQGMECTEPELWFSGLEKRETRKRVRRLLKPPGRVENRPHRNCPPSYAFPGWESASRWGSTVLQAIRTAVSGETRISCSQDGTGAAGADVGICVIGETPYKAVVLLARGYVADTEPCR